jgi:hypothetical protein
MSKAKNQKSLGSFTGFGLRLNMAFDVTTVAHTRLVLAPLVAGRRQQTP